MESGSYNNDYDFTRSALRILNQEGFCVEEKDIESKVISGNNLLLNNVELFLIIEEISSAIGFLPRGLFNLRGLFPSADGLSYEASILYEEIIKCTSLESKNRRVVASTDDFFDLQGKISVSERTEMFREELWEEILYYLRPEIEVVRIFEKVETPYYLVRNSIHKIVDDAIEEKRIVEKIRNEMKRMQEGSREIEC